MTLRNWIKSDAPKCISTPVACIFYLMKRIQYRIFGRPQTQLETAKAHRRREQQGFFDKYCKGQGLDIGYGGDLLCANCRGWDFEHGNAQYLRGIKDSQFDFAYSGHTLEHMVDPETALSNWWRVVKSGGYLILYVPDRDLYEKKKTLPSRWNPDHKHFFLLSEDEEPHTKGLLPLIAKSLSNYEVVYARVCSDGSSDSDSDAPHTGEYSIEVVLKKLY
ncbi:class I SAM-dependent methyltransferase [bacterium]|nr:class I SAM-dependent methyltransferase [bacterium]